MLTTDVNNIFFESVPRGLGSNWMDRMKADYRIFLLMEIWIWNWVLVEFTVSQELLLLTHGDSSVNHRKEIVRRWKPLPEDWWRDNRLRRLSTCAVVNCRKREIDIEWIKLKSCKCPINPVTNPNPIYSHTTLCVTIFYPLIVNTASLQDWFHFQGSK
jgi:hypothetical protein